jgi:CheY-like chemotaxis protein
MTKRILTVDDDDLTTEIVKVHFQRQGYQVDCASDGEEAWELIEQQKPDIIITDYEMPRLNGLGLAARVFQDPATADIPSVMLTGKRNDLLREQGRNQFGIRAVLCKPFNPADLLLNIELIMGAVEYAEA